MDVYEKYLLLPIHRNTQHGLMEKCMFMLNFSRDALLHRRGYGKFILIPHKVENGF